MMNLSILPLRFFGLIPITVFAVSCAQSGASPTSPSSLTGAQGGASPASPSSLTGAPAAVAVGPSAGYDATGRWHFVQTSANPNLNDTFDADVIQDPTTGDLSLSDETGNPVILERLSQGAGAIITYRFALIDDEGGACDLRIQGTARLDTSTNTITLPIRLKELGCENGRAGAVVIGTKLS